MTFLLFFLVYIVSGAIDISIGIGVPDDTAMIIMAILTAGEVIAHACEKR